jgi:molybdenum cofactor synthesis domain-containing protein
MRIDVEIRAAVLTVSDRSARGERADESGKVLAELLSDAGARVVFRDVVSDELGPLVEKLRWLAGHEDVNLVVTTGGTGLGPRDNTPEATRAVIEREVPGMAEAMRAESLGKTPTAMLSRGVCGVCGDALVVNLPGSPKAVRECFAVLRPVLAHAISVIAGGSHE